MDYAVNKMDFPCSSNSYIQRKQKCIKMNFEYLCCKHKSKIYFGRNVWKAFFKLLYVLKKSVCHWMNIYTYISRIMHSEIFWVYFKAIKKSDIQMFWKQMQQKEKFQFFQNNWQEVDDIKLVQKHLIYISIFLIVYV